MGGLHVLSRSNKSLAAVVVFEGQPVLVKAGLKPEFGSENGIDRS